MAQCTASAVLREIKLCPLERRRTGDPDTAIAHLECDMAPSGARLVSRYRAKPVPSEVTLLGPLQISQHLCPYPSNTRQKSGVERCAIQRTSSVTAVLASQIREQPAKAESRTWKTPWKFILTSFWNSMGSVWQMQCSRIPTAWLYRPIVAHTSRIHLCSLDCWAKDRISCRLHAS